MIVDTESVARWLAPLQRAPEDIADVFVEERRETEVLLRDGEVAAVSVLLDAGVAARAHREGTQRLVYISRADDGGAREAIRALRAASACEPLPIRSARAAPPDDRGLEILPGLPRARRRLETLLARHMPRHRLRWTLTETARQIISAGGDAVTAARRLVSIEGEFTAASRRRDEARLFSLHTPDIEMAGDSVRAAFEEAAAPREKAVPCTAGEIGVVFAGGCAAILFHEILSHPGEAGAGSPLESLADARVAVSELTVRDEPGRLDLFGGYEADDEGTRPRPVRLLDAGRLAGRLTDRAHRGRSASTGHARRARPSDPPLPRGSNIVVAPGNVTEDEMARRLQTGLWIEQLRGGSVELSSGRFRLSFPRARRVRRGRLADEIGPGTIAGDILSVLKQIEGGLGRETRSCLSLGWCARDGQVIPVGGEAPAVLVRRLSLRPDA
jgi:predicted Zn-dependent protease